MKSPLLIIIIFLLSACQFATDNVFGSFPHANKFLQRFPQNQKSLVILKSTTDNLIWCKVQKESDAITDEDFCLEIKPKKQNQVLLFDPGIYKLLDYSSIKEDYIFGKSREKLSSKNSLVINLAAQEIVYIGSITRVGTKYQAESEFEILKKAFRSKNYQELKDSIILNLQDLEQLVNLAQENLSQKIAAPVNYEKNLNKKLKNSCQPICNQKLIDEKEAELKLHRDKYSQKYITKLEKEIATEKLQCSKKLAKTNDGEDEKD